ncbi:DNA-directed RNA polymerase [Butyriboletus roseoflavus]|nr:DNA-directed RNA polymerase [Butyriboletus roseoflavus]
MTGFDPKRHVGVHPERVSHVSSTDYPGHLPAQDEAWNFTKFQQVCPSLALIHIGSLARDQRLTVRVERLSNRSIDLDLIGVDASIANAFRRILIAEVPTICIERVYVWCNTSVIADEVFAHRLGLVPLNVDPALMEFNDPQNDQATDRNTLVFRLQATCERRKNVPKDATDPNVLFINSEILSSQLEWVPQGEQGTPTNPNIVLAKLRPGQEIEMELHAIKGVGKDHAKFSPVATASYRLLPEIILNPEKPVPPDLAENFQKCFSPGIIRLHPRTKKVSVDKEFARFESMSREVYRHPEFDGCVQLARVRDHFLFCIESEGFYPPERLLPEAIQVMRTKIATLRRAAEALLHDSVSNEDAEMEEA